MKPEKVLRLIAYLLWYAGGIGCIEAQPEGAFAEATLDVLGSVLILGAGALLWPLINEWVDSLEPKRGRAE